MAKQPVITRKKRPPVTGTLLGVRLQPDALYRLDAWIERQVGEPTRPEAIRKLMEQALDALDEANRRKRK